MAKVLYCGKDLKCPCAALTGGEMQADELFGMEFDDGFAPRPASGPRPKGVCPH